MDDFDVVYQEAKNTKKNKSKGKSEEAVPAYADPRNLRKVKEAITAYPITVRRLRMATFMTNGR